ncbi:MULTISPECIES: phosphoribosylanthranilate isomerase [Trichocoleus]|uniref:N-(5'-phosphoribosyl)anthranilate isomerase n=1 Tax=Trichocoleus desertorum GB2-A4 TaxID=2933944 RepID=A0ABV0J9N6_9CYAN|nr:phosphoribosylanthranilate isomerase [Trichocoleus sp. FACHB-46]MBD1862168.1 phosphoribosylanthranilate isomerase [Trichocoleus sp. FACHB-46]
MRVKICGITKPDQGRAIAELGATSLGFICVPVSPRYVSADQIRQVVEQLPLNPQTGHLVDRIGVFANATLAEISQVVAIAGLNAVQLHGAETPEFCAQVRETLPDTEVIKALRIKTAAALQEAAAYYSHVHTLLLDAYHPGMLGGTGVTLDWQSLQQFAPACPWFLAGGLNPDNIIQALAQLQPDGIDLSSGVERSPGDKDLAQVAQLFHQLQQTQKIGVS